MLLVTSLLEMEKSNREATSLLVDSLTVQTEKPPSAEVPEAAQSASLVKGIDGSGDAFLLRRKVEDLTNDLEASKAEAGTNCMHDCAHALSA